MRVSVAITNHNYDRYVGAAIESVLAQTRPADQIVIVDDGSTDDSRSVIEQYRSRVIAVLTENRGAVAATNEAVAHCDGDVVAFLDADDLALPGRLAALARVYESDPGVQWVFNPTRRVDRASLRPLPARNIRMPTGRQDVRAGMRSGVLPASIPPSSGLSFRRSLLDELMPLPEGPGNQDILLALLAMRQAAGYMLDEPLTLHGIHDSNRFSGTSGGARDRALARHHAWLARSLQLLAPDVPAISDSFAARALWRSRIGLRLPSVERRLLIRHLLSIRAARQGRVARLLLRYGYIDAVRVIRRGGRR